MLKAITLLLVVVMVVVCVLIKADSLEMVITLAQINKQKQRFNLKPFL